MPLFVSEACAAINDKMYDQAKFENTKWLSHEYMSNMSDCHKVFIADSKSSSAVIFLNQHK